MSKIEEMIQIVFMFNSTRNVSCVEQMYIIIRFSNTQPVIKNALFDLSLVQKQQEDV